MSVSLDVMTCTPYVSICILCCHLHLAVYYEQISITMENTSKHDDYMPQYPI